MGSNVGKEHRTIGVCFSFLKIGSSFPGVSRHGVYREVSVENTERFVYE